MYLSFYKIHKRTKMLQSKTLEIIKNVVPIFRTQGEEITKEFYKILFSEHPQVRSMFNAAKQQDGRQPKALANAVLDALENIENLEAIQDSIGRISKIHVKLGVQPEQYPIVGQCLLRAIRNVLGTQASDEVLNALSEGYQKIANFYIAKERELYAQQGCKS